ncbi:MAG TPA: FtsX-like permease family protein [Candidatus Dormibacteraeota bacterium]
MLKATIVGLFAHKLRLALAGFAVVLGVSFVVGTLVLGDTVNKTFDDLFNTATAGIDVAVRGTSTGSNQVGQAVYPPFPASTLDTVKSVSGVKEAFGQVNRIGTVILGTNGKPVTSGGAPSLGLLWNPYPDLSGLTLRSGSPPQGKSQVVIDAHTAQAQGFRVGSTVTIILPVGQPQSFTMSGITGFGSQDNLAGATIAAFDATVGPALLGAPDELDGISIKADSGVSVGQLQARVAAVLPAGTEAITGQALAQEQSDAVRTLTNVLSTFLLVFALISLFVGSFIILNTFSILVAQRQRELALLRAMGATRGQVLRSVLLEAAITGLVASAVGVLFGLLIAKGLEALLGTIGLDLGGTPLQFGPRAALIGLAVGTVVTVVASMVPARKATRVSPVEALREAAPSPTAVSRTRVITGLTVVGAGVLLLLLGLFVASSNQLLLTGAGALLTFVGVAILAAIVVPPVVGALGRPVIALRGVPGRLASENARRNPRRTAATASALMIGVGLVSCFTVVAASFKSSVNKIVDTTITADYIITPVSQGGDGFSPAVAENLRKDSAIATVSAITFGNFHSGGASSTFEGIEPATIDQVAISTIQQGVPLSRLGDGDVAISEDAAKNLSLRLFDIFPMQFARAGVHQQRISTIYARNPLFGDYLVTLATARAGSIQPLDFVVAVKGAPGVSQADLRSRVEAVTKQFPTVQVQNNAEYKASQAGQIDTLLNLITVLVVLAIIIALLGVINTVALSIVERTRELGLVRALGMTRGQMRSMVRWETVLITVFGTLLGLAVGLFFGAALVKAFASQGVDTLSFAFGQQLIYVLIAVVAGFIAAIMPARRASRVNMLEAIVTE